jgi:peroxisomal enoyl-CoA hydratase 2
MRQLPLADAVPGAEYSELIIGNLPRSMMVQYAGASGDYNPLHTDEIYATQAAGYPTVLAHGMLIMGLTGRTVTDLVGDGQLRSFGGRFRGPVWPGDSLNVRAVVVSASEEGHVNLELATTNQHGEPVFTGTASAALAHDKGATR